MLCYAQYAFRHKWFGQELENGAHSDWERMHNVKGGNYKKTVATPFAIQRLNCAFTMKEHGGIENDTFDENKTMSHRCKKYILDSKKVVYK